MTKMNPEVKARWIAALRSGEYRQAKGQLRGGPTSFCCLGVLCDIYAKDMGGVWEGSEFFDAEGYSRATYPPEGVTRWAALQGHTGGEVSIHGGTYCLADHNDGGRTFAEIADAIEEQL